MDFRDQGDLLNLSTQLAWLYKQFWCEEQPEPVEARTTQGEVDREQVLNALRFIDSNDYDVWLRVGMALHAEGFPLDVWDRWSQSSNKYDARACQEKWKSFSGSRIGLGTLFHYAMANGFHFQRDIDSSSPERNDQKDPPISWQQPVLFGNISTPDIDPTKVLPPCIAEYVQAVAAATQTPPGMSVMLVLSVLATCLQKRFEVSPFGDDYTEPLSLWTITALPPASRKTAVITALTQPLSDWEKEQSVSLRKQIAQRQAERSIIEKRIDGLEKQAAKTDDSEERQRLTVLVAELKEMLPDEIIAPRLWTGNITPERLQGLMVEHGGKMAAISDEGGIFEVMAGLYSDGKSDIDIFLQAHAGSAVRVDRNSREAHIDKPALTFGLAVQPSVISDLSQGSKKRFRGTGALARFLYLIPRSNIGTRDVAKRQPITAELKAAYAEKIRSLLNIPATTSVES